MATKSATDINKALWSGDCGNLGVFYGTITDTPATGDVWRMCKLPAGMKVTKVSITNADLGTAAPGDIGYLPVDGSSGSATAFASAYAAGTATVAGAPYTLLFNGTEITKDSYLAITWGTINTGASGAVQVVVQGELFGAK